MMAETAVPTLKKRARRTRPRGVKPGDPMARSQPQSAAARARAKGISCPLCKTKHPARSVGTDWSGCNGHLKKVRPFKPCTRDPINGGEVCSAHGGNLPQVRAAAQRRVTFASQQGEVAELLRQCDLPDQHPLDGLLEVVRHSGGMMRLLGAMVGDLNLKPFAGGVYSSLYGPNHLGDGAPHTLVVLYEHWANMYARACKLALDANIDERLVRNAEATTTAVYTAIERALLVAQLDPEQQQKFTSALGEELRKLVDPLQGKVIDV